MDAPAPPVIEAPAPLSLAEAGLYAFHDPCVLGTYLNLLIRADRQTAAYEAACRARREIDRLDRIFNWRDEASEISRLNESARHGASTELFAVAQAAERWRELSAGAYSGRIGRLLAAWRASGPAPDAGAMAQLADYIARADVGLDPATRTIMRSDAVQFDFDAIAKGYIIDRAIEAALTLEPEVNGVMADIGGDVRCAGEGPHDGFWRVVVPEPLTVFDNSLARGAFMLANGAIATSGCGPRDLRMGGGVVSVTLDPRTGWPVVHQRSASAVAATAMEADALATVMLVAGEVGARELLERMPGASGRITRPDGVDWLHGRTEPLARWIDYEEPQQAGVRDGEPVWEEGWVASITFSAPPKDMRRSLAFRSPYVAIWVSDETGQVVRTLLLIGKIKEWQEFNHIWWRLNRGRTEQLINGRSMSTRGSGIYKVFWDGVDDDGQRVKPGKYKLHVETSRERGEHTHRTLEIDASAMRAFTTEIPMNPDTGGLSLEFKKF